MSENENSSHWQSLASELGAEIAPRAAKPQVVPPAALPRIKKKPSAPPPGPPKGNWQDLAASLGVDVPPPPPKPAAAAKPVEAQPAGATPPARTARPAREDRESQRRRSRDQESGRSSHRRHQPDRPPRPASPQLGPSSGEAVEYVHAEHVDAELVGAEFVDDIDLLEDLDEPLAARDATAEPRGEAARERDDDQRGGGRRRRRRRGGRHLRKEAEAARSETPRDQASDFLEVEREESDEPIADFLDDIEATPAGDVDEAEGTEQREPGEKRRRGRRRGRGRGRRCEAPRDDVQAAPERTAAPDDDMLDELAAIGAPRHGRDEIADDDLAEVQADDDANGDGEPDDAEMRPSHRAIPSWQEAVGMIVAGNMESRAKNPHAGSQRARGRGGRGRGRGRERR